MKNISDYEIQRDKGKLKYNYQFFGAIVNLSSTFFLSLKTDFWLCYM